MVSKTRAVRIAERIREDLSELIFRSVQDPRIAGMTVTEVKVDRELAFADVFVSALEGSERSVEILAGLEHAQGFLRTELARKIDLRHFPRLRFHWDEAYEKAERINQLIAQLHQENRSQETPPRE